MKPLVYLLLLLSMASCRVGQLPNNDQNADLLYSKRHYFQAATMYKTLIKKQKNPTVKKAQTLHLADCYRQLNQYNQAILWYEKVVTENPDDPSYLYILADLNMSIGNYKKAANFFQTHIKEVPGAELSKEKLKRCIEAQQLDVTGSRYKVTPLYQLNTTYNEYAPIFLDDQLHFTSDRSDATGGLRSPQTGNFYSDIYSSTREGINYDKPTKLGTQINTALNEGANCFNSSGNIMIFTKCSGEGFDSSCALLVSSKERGSWSKPEIIDFGIADQYMYGHPCLSSDGKTLYFTSNIPGGYGGHDLYQSKKVNGAWSRPENLGSKINTKGDEFFPNIHKDRSLYFSSNGHSGFGALDIFVSELKKEAWRKPKNLLPPINSGADDINFNFIRDQNEGYFSSNREKGQGDDLYHFTKITPPNCTLDGFAYDKKTKKPLTNTRILVQNLRTEETVYIETDQKGYYKLDLAYEEDFRLDAYKKFYTNSSSADRISTRNLNFRQTYSQDFYLSKWTIDEITIEGILYDVNSDKLRPESKVILDSLSRILENHYYLVVELSSHTDCRASEEYNKDLSQRRAESCVNYLISKGIATERIIPKGYGESKLVNDCACEGEKGKGLDCTEEQHQKNRRTSFQILRTDFEPENEPSIGTEYVPNE